MKNETKYLLLLTACYFAVSFVGILHHELWLDESHHWLLARDSTSLPDLIRNTRYEGHPILWNILLFVITRFTLNPFWMQFLHIIISTAVVAFFLKKAPFSWWFKSLFIFGYFMLFEYNLISRNYILGVLFLFLACSAIKNSRKNFTLLCLYLALASNVHLMFSVISFALFLILLFENLKQNELFAQRFLPGYAIFGIGLLLISLQIMKTDSTWFFNFVNDIPLTERFTHGFISLFKGIITIPDFRTIHFWNTNLPVHLSKTISGILGMLLYLLPLVLFSKNKKILCFVYIAFIGTQLFFFVTQRLATRFDGINFFIIIIALWIEHYDQKEPWHFPKKSIVYCILFIHLFSGITAYAIDYRYPFTASKKVVDYLKEKQLSNKKIVTLTCDGTMLSSYLQRKIYFLTDKSEQSYCHWEAKTIGVLYTKDMIITMLTDYLNKNHDAIFISGCPFLNIPKDHSWQSLNNQIKIRKLISFDENIQENANFSIYEVATIKSAKE